MGALVSDIAIGNGREARVLGNAWGGQSIREILIVEDVVGHIVDGALFVLGSPAITINGPLNVGVVGSHVEIG